MRDTNIRERRGVIRLNVEPIWTLERMVETPGGRVLAIVRQWEEDEASLRQRCRICQKCIVEPDADGRLTCIVMYPGEGESNRTTTLPGG